jgi:hypothetical protein
VYHAWEWLKREQMGFTARYSCKLVLAALCLAQARGVDPCVPTTEHVEHTIARVAQAQVRLAEWGTRLGVWTRHAKPQPRPFTREEPGVEVSASAGEGWVEAVRPARVSVSSEWRAAERRHPTGHERTGSPTLQTLQEPILLLPWVWV